MEPAVPRRRRAGRPGARARHAGGGPQRAGVLLRRSGPAAGSQSSWCVLGPGPQLGVFGGSKNEFLKITFGRPTAHCI